MISEGLNRIISASLNISIYSISAISGGSINRVYCLETSRGKYLLKVNSKSSFPDMFKREQEGLLAIAATNTIAVPRVIGRGDTGDQSYLLLEWITPGTRTVKISQLLGEQLAQMHRHTASQFGFETDNYMGSLVQSNKRHTSWADFFIYERLKPMIDLANIKGYLTAKDQAIFEMVINKMGEMVTDESPALIHGDLWSGNYLTGPDLPYLIDPAVSYSHRECDIALTTLFGGFDRAFYEAYHAAYPLQAGWQQRIDLYNLYPLLLHLNLFGESYLGQVRDCLSSYL